MTTGGGKDSAGEGAYRSWWERSRHCAQVEPHDAHDFASSIIGSDWHCPGVRTPYDRAVLVEVLVYHHRKDIRRCGCGWGELGRSHSEHVADVYEQSVAARGDDRPGPPS